MTGTGGPHDGRVALVVGGTGGIGRAVAGRLAAAGARVAVHGNTRPDVARQVAGELTGGLPVVADLTDRGAVEQVFDRVEQELGPVGLLVNTVHPGALQPTPVGDLADDLLDAHLDGVRLHAALCRRALPAMRRRRFGRVVYVSGALMARPVPGLGAYGAAKAAASVLTRYLALEEGRRGVTANVVAPGRVCEPDEPEPEDPTMRAAAEALSARMALPRFPTAGDVADVVVGLTLPHSDQLTGQTLWVTGGEPVG